MKAEVHPFVRKPMQCYNCFKFGHTSGTCKGKKVCIMCDDEDHPNKECASSPKCTNCSEPHRSNDFHCIYYQKQVEINHIMAYDNKSFIEAKQLVFSNMATPPQKSQRSFPELNKEKKENLGSNSLVSQGFHPIPNPVTTSAKSQNKITITKGNASMTPYKEILQNKYENTTDLKNVNNSQRLINITGNLNARPENDKLMTGKQTKKKK